MGLKVRVDAGRHTDRSQLIVPFDEFDNLNSVSFRSVPVPARLGWRLGRPIHFSGLLIGRNVAFSKAHFILVRDLRGVT